MDKVDASNSNSIVEENNFVISSIYLCSLRFNLEYVLDVN